MKATVTDGIPVPVYHAEPTLARFHASDAFFRGVRGPLGSGKSVGCCAEVMSRILFDEKSRGLGEKVIPFRVFLLGEPVPPVVDVA